MTYAVSFRSMDDSGSHSVPCTPRNWEVEGGQSLSWRFSEYDLDEDLESDSKKSVSNIFQHACYFPRDDDEESRPARPAQLVGSVMELRKPSSNDFSDKGFLTSRRNSSSSDTAGLKTARQNRVSSVSAGSLRNVSSSSVRFHLLNEKSHSFSGSLPSTDRSVPVEKHSSVKESKIYRQRDRVEKNKKRYEEAENKRVEMLSKYKEVLKRYSEKGKKISRDQWKDMQDSLKTFEEKRDLEWQRYTSSLVNLQIVSDLPFSSPIR